MRQGSPHIPTPTMRTQFRRAAQMTVVSSMPAGMALVTTCTDPTLMKALARTFRHKRLLVRAKSTGWSCSCLN